MGLSYPFLIVGLRFPSLGPSFYSGAPLSSLSPTFIVGLHYPSLGPTFHSGAPLSVSGSKFS